MTVKQIRASSEYKIMPTGNPPKSSLRKAELCERLNQYVKTISKHKTKTISKHLPRPPTKSKLKLKPIHKPNIKVCGLSIPRDQVVQMLRRNGINAAPEKIRNLCEHIEPRLIDHMLAHSSGIIISPAHRMRLVPKYMTQWTIVPGVSLIGEDAMGNKKDKLRTLKEVLTSLPLTKSIKWILADALDHRSYIKSSNLVNRVFTEKDIREYKANGLPSPVLGVNNDMISLVALADECNYLCEVTFDDNGMLIMSRYDIDATQFLFRDTDKAVNRLLQILEEVDPNCARIIYLNIPGHAMVLSIRGQDLYIYDTNDMVSEPSWCHYWTTRSGEDPEKISAEPPFIKVLTRFFDILMSHPKYKHLYVNNNFEPGKAPGYVYPIPKADICPNFQGFSEEYKKIVKNTTIPMFPGGFCQPWSYIVQAMHLTYGSMANSMLKDLYNPVHYRPIFRLFPGISKNRLVGKVILLMIHSISVYLVEISTNRLADFP